MTLICLILVNPVLVLTDWTVCRIFNYFSLFDNVLNTVTRVCYNHYMIGVTSSKKELHFFQICF